MFVVVARSMEVGGGRNRSRNLAGAEKGTGWRRRFTAPQPNSLHEEGACDTAVLRVVTERLGVVRIDSDDELAGARVSAVIF